ncbi:MAG: hypothetical protein Q8L29_00295, partial [archaeon]|nr:hypothetical protein [archaeon]
MRKIFLLFALILSLNFASAVLLSDVGNDVREIATGNLTSGNVTISIYDASAGGNLIYNQSFLNSIANGSWNVAIEPDLQFGKFYWKDIIINGDDLDFDGNERLKFQSSLGLINNNSFVNFSLIDACSAGNAIRKVNANGSVICESISSSGNSGGWTNDSAITSTSLSINVTGNVTTANYGFFGWLGSLTSRITKLFVADIDVSNNINVSGNVTATYFIGNGSQLTGVSASGSTYNATYHTWSYNQTTPAISYTNALNASYNKYWYNMSDGTGSSNSTFNQTLTGLLYAGIQWGYNQTYSGSTYNATYHTWSYNQTTPAISYTNALNASYNKYWYN